ncbi:tetratricopeptide domain-containing protein [Desulfonema limicola]|uniref:Tetratricopeptide domain-containing protein n=1 Tax=Desulfonema limicola TaxID=45656 RepID=A0A975GEH3_9BACT|nr:hypothetical protein [Desulfonema limicola]QTA78222.1 tetratricopeptide domain-containing protein [Desulfonema limicola]
MCIKIQILKTIFIFICLFLSGLNPGLNTGQAHIISENTTDIETQETGSFCAVTDTPDVKIYINGELEGLAHPQRPLTREYLPAGTIIVTAKPRGFPSVSKPVVISPGNLSELVFEFALKDSDEEKPDPEPALSLEQLITQGDKYFQNQRYMMPEHENAFKMYESALKLAPDNSHARKKIYEMLEIYKNLGSSNENQNYEKALIYYKNYMYILEYCLDTFQDLELKALVEQVGIKVSELENKIELSDKLAQEADSYFIAQKFTTPKDKNAFILYKASLEANPGNNYSIKRIHEIIRLYKKQGDQAFQKGFYKKAQRFYKKYLSVAEYALEKFKSRRIERDMEAVKKRIEEIKKHGT